MKNALGSVQSVLVLGGGSEIGQATARALVARRARTVVLGARNPEALKPFADELRNAGATTAEVVHFDALETDEHAGVVNDLFATYGGFDVVLVAFGVLGEQAVAESDPQAALEIIQTNYVGAVSAMIPVAQRLRAQGHGTIVVLSTVAAERARKANFIYGSSKAGLDAFSQGLGDSLFGAGVKVVVVRPGFVKTKMTHGMRPAPFSTSADAVAEAIVGALRTGAETIWVPPILRWVMTVVRHLPRPIFRKLPL